MSPTAKTTKASQLRRNERERKRVNQVNDGFERLRNHVPKASINKKLSKADTLREAVKYINYLTSLLDNSFSSPMPAYSQCEPHQFFNPSNKMDIKCEEMFYQEMGMQFSPPNGQMPQDCVISQPQHIPYAYNYPQSVMRQSP